METAVCPVCESPALAEPGAGRRAVRCCRCGEFALSDAAEAMLRRSQRTPRQVALLSGWLREHWGSTLNERDLAAVLDSRMPTVGEKAERLLLHFARVFPTAGGTLSLGGEPPEKEVLSEDELGRNATHQLALLATGYCQDYAELYYLLKDWLTEQGRFLYIEPGHFWPSKITPAGWARIHELQQGRGSGAVGFIAMWFDASMKPAFAAIHNAIAAAGYEPVRLDQVEHNNQIDDEIIARIRASRFLVADLTGHRGGVYFEAGFALGLGLPVIWLCREDALAGVHFDNRQYNFITWHASDLAELEKRLRLRIEATLGRGPLRPPA